MPKIKSSDIVHILTPVRRSLGTKIAFAWTVRGIAAGALAGAISVALLRVAGWPYSGLVGFACIGVGICAGAAVGVLKWPSYLQAARAADRHFDLADRMTTTLEIAGTENAMAGLQRAEMKARIEGLTLLHGSRTPLRRRDIMLIAGGLAFVLALIAIPKHSTPRVARAASVSESDAQRIHRVAVIDIPTMIRNLEAGLTAPQRRDSTIQLLRRELVGLQRQLLATHSREVALRSISIIQNQLQRQDATLRPLSSKSVDQLTRALGLATGKNANQRSPQDLSQQALRDAQALRQLASSLKNLNSTQRLRLAGSMRKSVRSISDHSIRDALDKASLALSHNNIPVAQHYLRQLASALNSRTKSTATHKQLHRMQQALNQAKGRLNSLVRANLNHSTGSTGGRLNRQTNSQQPPSGPVSPQTNVRSSSGTQKGGSAAQRGGNSRQAPRAATTNQNSKSGSVTRVQRRVSGLGGNNINVTPTTQNQQAGGRFVKVFVPGKIGRGPVFSQTGRNSAPRQARFVPYRQILVQYRRDARLALEHANLPPDEQSYVRRYFTAIASK